MLDTIRKAVHPDGLKAELETVQTELQGRLNLREQRRRAYSEMAADRMSDNLKSSDREMNTAYAQIDSDASEIKELRRRRSELVKLLTPVTAAKARLIDVPIPSALAKVNQQLNEASERRQALRVEMYRFVSSSDTHADLNARKTTKKIEALEDEIIALRARRDELRRPYDVAVSEALHPLIGDAAERLLLAAQEANAALAVLKEAAEILPSLFARTVPPAISGVWQIDQLPLSSAIEFAIRLGAFPHGEIAE